MLLSKRIFFPCGANLTTFGSKPDTPLFNPRVTISDLIMSGNLNFPTLRANKVDVQYQGIYRLSKDYTTYVSDKIIGVVACYPVLNGT